MQTAEPFFYRLSDRAERARVGKGLGLVSVPYLHESPVGPALVVHEGGGVLRLKCPSDGKQSGADLGERGAVTKFTPSSARRFRIRLAEVLDSAFEGAVLLTMTYPAELDQKLEDWSFYKAHLRAYKAALIRTFPGSSGFWKLEFQKNGRPHFHCIVFGLEFARSQQKLAEFIKWHSRTWYRIVGSKLSKHLLAGTRAEYPKHREGARHYIAKYAAKQEQACQGFTGRYWGQINSQAIPWAVEVRKELTERQAVVVRRVLRNVVKAQAMAVRWKRALSAYKGVSRLQAERMQLSGFRWPKRFQMRKNRSIVYLGVASSMRACLMRCLHLQYVLPPAT